MFPIEIITNVWLSNFDSLKKKTTFLKEKNIQLIINCSIDLPFLKHMKDNSKLLRVKIDDNFNTDIKKLMKVNNHIYSNYFNKDLGVLFYCYTGQQLSASIISTLILEKTTIEIKDLIDSIKSKNKTLLITNNLTEFLNKYNFIKKSYNNI